MRNHKIKTIDKETSRKSVPRNEGQELKIEKSIVKEMGSFLLCGKSKTKRKISRKNLEIKEKKEKKFQQVEKGLWLVITTQELAGAGAGGRLVVDGTWGACVLRLLRKKGWKCRPRSGLCLCDRRRPHQSRRKSIC